MMDDQHNRGENLLYGKDTDGKSVLATPEKTGVVCSGCETILIPKCGEIKIWHWAHKVAGFCEYASEPETDWHLSWKETFRKQGFKIEYKIKDTKGWKVTDVCDIQSKVNVEIQSSSISPEELRIRNTFYRENGFKTIWIFNAEKWRLSFRDKDGYWSFRWYHPHQSLYPLFSGIIKPKAVIFDFNLPKRGLMEVKTCYFDSEKVRGSCKFIEFDDIIQKFKREFIWIKGKKEDEDVKELYVGGGKDG